MKMKFHSLLALSFAACSHAPNTSAPTPAPTVRASAAPYYRFFRGVKLPTLSRKVYEEKLSKDFIPTLPKLYSSEILKAYMPAIPPLHVSKPELAEIALIVYASEEIYKKARATPEGQAYGDLHWTVFDKEKSKTGPTIPFTGKVVVDTPYDVLGKDVDWYSGYTTLFVGLKKKNKKTEDFHSWLATHVSEFSKSFGSLIRGYVFVAGEDYEIAYVNWISEEAMKAGFAGPYGKHIAGDASLWMENKMFERLSEFDGKVSKGAVYRMPIRSP